MSHSIHIGTKAIFVYGNRVAPDYFEGLVQTSFSTEVDLIARSGLIGKVKTKSSHIKDPTQVRILGYVVNENINNINTRAFSRISRGNRKKMSLDPK